MQRATLKNLGIRWWYWLIVLAFGGAGIGAFLATKSEPESRTALIVCGALFSTISLLALLWSFLRIRERQGPEFISTSSRRVPYRGTLIPSSSVKLMITLV